MSDRPVFQVCCKLVITMFVTSSSQEIRKYFMFATIFYWDIVSVLRRISVVWSQGPDTLIV